MKKAELKEIIKQCVRETLFEDGVLSDIIAEVAYGVAKAQSLMVEAEKSQNNSTKSRVKPAETETRLTEQTVSLRSEKLLETKKKMAAAIGSPSMKHVFEGTTPLSSAGSPGASQSPTSPLNGISPQDSGVDISGLLGIAGKKWQQLK